MIKIAFIALLMVTLSVGVIFFTSLNQHSNPSSSTIIQPTGSNEPSPTTGDQTNAESDQIDSRVTSLEATVKSLQYQLSSSSSPTPLTSIQPHQPPLYIPFGSGNGGAISTQDWTTTTLPQAIINADNYSGYTSFQLQITLRVFQGNGQAYARLFDVTDGVAVAGSDVSTISQDYTSLVSAKFQLPHGEKNYRIQLKSATGYEADFEDISLRVNYN